jgi:hypothetical protein
MTPVTLRFATLHYGERSGRDCQTSSNEDHIEGVCRQEFS